MTTAPHGELEHLSRFVGSLVHELGTPLASLGLLLDLAEDAEASSARSRVQSAHQVIAEMRRLLRSVSELTKLASGRHRMERGAVRLEDLLTDLGAPDRPAQGTTQGLAQGLTQGLAQGLAQGLTQGLTQSPGAPSALEIVRVDPLPDSLHTDRVAAVKAIRAAAAYAVEQGGTIRVVVEAVDEGLRFVFDAPAPTDPAAWSSPVETANLAAARRATGSGLELALAAALATALGGALEGTDAGRARAPALALRLPVDG